MQINVGFEMGYQFHQPTPVLAALNVHYTRASDLVKPDTIQTTPPVPLTGYRDLFGNWCTRFVAPAGDFLIRSDAILEDDGSADPLNVSATQTWVDALPDSTMLYLLGSRYCETDQLSPTAWNLFGSTTPGWSRVQAICDFVHRHIEFGYAHARRTRTALEAYQEGRGVCRDYAHLAIAFCRCMNIPARYCTGYVTDIGQPPPYAAMDFAGWMEAYIDDRWYTFDPRNNQPRIGRVLMAYGRDATDVALTNTFGSNVLTHFKVWADRVAS